MRRDFTYVALVPYNIGNNTPVAVSHAVALLKKDLGSQAKIELAPMQSATCPKPRPTSTT
jgi:hypothetical protein